MTGGWRAGDTVAGDDARRLVADQIEQHSAGLRICDSNAWSIDLLLGNRTKKISSTFYLAVVVLPAIFSSRSSSTYRQWV